MPNLQNYEHYLTEFKTFENNGASKSPAWVHALRKAALETFSKRGFPSTREEDWKYTNIAPIAKAPFAYSSDALPHETDASTVASFLLKDIPQHTIVMVNGHFSREHSRLSNLPHGVVVTNLREAFSLYGETIRHHIGRYVGYEGNSFAAMNTSFINDGVFVRVEAGVEVKEPIHLLFVSMRSGNQQLVSHIRNLVLVEERAKVNFIHQFRGADDNTNLTNAVTEIVAQAGSAVEFVKVQKESDTAFHVENLRVHQYDTSNIHVFSLALGSAIARNDLSVVIDGPKAECNLNGLYMCTGDQLVDHHTFMHHIHPDCPSHELFKGILHGNSRAVFNGKVYVNPEAQKTDSKQTNRNLLLSDDAIVDTKPELEIFADDVKCTHGAAVGGMNPTHMFYLKSRGIPEEIAKRILTVGFAAEVTGKIRTPELRKHVDTLVVERLREKLGASGLPEIVHG